MTHGRQFTAGGKSLMDEKKNGWRCDGKEDVCTADHTVLIIKGREECDSRRESCHVAPKIKNNNVVGDRTNRSCLPSCGILQGG